MNPAEQSGYFDEPSRPNLCPLQPFWDAWTPHETRIRALPYAHFLYTMEHQLVEAEVAEGMEKEWVDMISVALNALRFYYDLTAGEICDMMRERVETRYAGRTEEILDRYEEERRYTIVWGRPFSP